MTLKGKIYSTGTNREVENSDKLKQLRIKNQYLDSLLHTLIVGEYLQKEPDLDHMTIMAYHKAYEARYGT
jgi:hypothetical protein